MLVKFFSKDFHISPVVRFFLMIKQGDTILCKICNRPIENKERFYLCGNMDGSAWCNEHYTDNHFKKYKDMGVEKYHNDYRPWLIVAPEDLFESQQGQTIEFEALAPKQ